MRNLHHNANDQFAACAFGQHWLGSGWVVANGNALVAILTAHDGGFPDNIAAPIRWDDGFHNDPARVVRVWLNAGYGQPINLMNDTRPCRAGHRFNPIAIAQDQVSPGHGGLLHVRIRMERSAKIGKRGEVFLAHGAVMG